MIKRKIFLGLILIPMTLMSQTLLTNTGNRNTTSLNGDWNCIVDPYENGYLNFHAQVFDQKDPASIAAYYNNYHAKNKSELVEYDFDKSPTLVVPGDWNTQKETLLFYEGSLWYKKSFNYDLKENKRLFVYFGAINYKADVYLNGTKLGTHEGGFTPFNFEITQIVKPQDNYLVVKVDNSRSEEAVPTKNTDWWNYGGITRDVLLIEEPAIFIQDYLIQLKKDNNSVIAGYVSLSNPVKDQKITVSIPELEIEKEVQTSADGKARFEMKVDANKAGNIKYWSPENPKLYQVILKTEYQTLKDDIGFRTIETKGADILLNGKSIFLRGISIHEEYHGRRATSESDDLALLTWAKELGCNYVRLAHYPHNEHMVRLADKLGLLVWEEIPVYWTVDFKNEASYKNAQNQLTEAITRDKNRASIIIWSMANETPLSEARNAFIINLINCARALDDTRLISAALLTRSENGVGILDDKLGAYVDILAFNQYTGWYGGDLATAPDAKWEILQNKPVVISEFGGGAKQGLHGTQDERWTEEYQEYLYQQNLLMFEKIAKVRGMSPWILTDFRSPRRMLPGIQDGFNRKGLLSEKGVKKKAFFVLQDFYKKKKLQFD
jgi:beta-glucuronidase